MIVVYRYSNQKVLGITNLPSCNLAVVSQIQWHLDSPPVLAFCQSALQWVTGWNTVSSARPTFSWGIHLHTNPVVVKSSKKLLIAQQFCVPIMWGQHKSVFTCLILCKTSIFRVFCWKHHEGRKYLSYKNSVLVLTSTLSKEIPNRGWPCATYSWIVWLSRRLRE